MVHECKVQCHSLDIKTLDTLGIEDTGKWLPFIFDMEIVDAAKLSSDDESSPGYNCTTIFTKTGDSYIIDTPAEEFFKKFTEYNNLEFPSPDEPGSDGDLEL